MPFKAGSIYGEASLDTKKWHKGLKSLKTGAVLVAGAIAAAFTVAYAKAIKAGNEFQIAMSNVNTIVDETVINTQQLALQILQLNPALGDATEIAKGLYQTFSAGAETAEEAMQTTIDAATFARAALTDTFTAVDVLTTAVNAYGKETMTTTKAADLFFTTIKLGKITGDELATTIGQSIPLYASAGIALEELNAGLAAMTKQGVSAANATTQLNSIVVMFLKPSVELTSVLANLGYESGAAFLRAEGLRGALELLEEATAGDAAEMAKLLPNIRALRGAMALTGVGGETFTQTLEAMSDATGVASEAFDEQEKTFATYKSASTNLMTVIGNIGKHFQDKITVSATNSTNAMIRFVMSTRAMEIVAQIVGFVAAAWEAIKTAVQPIIETIGPALKEIWAAIGELLGTLTGKTTSAGGALKILSVVVNIVSSSINIMTGQMVAGIMILKNWITAISATGKTISLFFRVLTKEVTWADVREQAASASEAFKDLGGAYKELFVGMFQTIRDEVIDFSGETEELTAKLIINTETAFNTASNNIRDNWGELLTGQENFMGDLESNFVGLPQIIDDGNEEGVESTESATQIIREKWIALWESVVNTGQLSYEELNRELGIAAASGLITLEEYEAVQLQLWTDHWDRMVDTVSESMNTILSVISYGTDTISSIADQSRTNESAKDQIQYQGDLKRLEKTRDDKLDIYEKELEDRELNLEKDFDLIDENLESGLITIKEAMKQKKDLQEIFNQVLLDIQNEFNTDKDKLDKDALNKENALREKAFTADKINRLIDVGINAATSIMGWWAQAPKLGPIAGPIFAEIMTAATMAASVAQAVLISSQKFVPAMEAGGMAGGLTRVNERGGEIITLPDNSQVIPADISRQISASVSGTVINVSFDGAKISDEMDLERVTNKIIRKLGKEMRLTG